MPAHCAHIALVPPGAERAPGAAPVPAPEPAFHIDEAPFDEAPAVVQRRGETLVARAALGAMLVGLGALVHAVLAPVESVAPAPVALPLAGQQPLRAPVVVRATAVAVPAPTVSAVAVARPVPAPKGQVRGLLRRGTSLVERGNARAALPFFQSAARLAPESADAWYGLALARAELGDLKLARRAAQKAVDAAPAHAQALVLLGFLDQLSSDVAGSRAHYERYLATNPGGPWASELTAVLSAIDEPLPTARQRTRR